MSLRRITAACAASLAMLALVPAAAAARSGSSGPSASPLVHIVMSGTAGNHKRVHALYTVDRFFVHNGKTYALGTLRGTIGHRNFRRTNVAIPVGIGQAAPGTKGARSAAVCPILHLDLGPLNLNLLGLHVHLNRVVLDITAVSGPGNLLGNLLCSVANLLNGGGLPVQQISGLLNILQQLVNVPGLLNL